MPRCNHCKSILDNGCGAQDRLVQEQQHSQQLQSQLQAAQASHDQAVAAAASQLAAAQQALSQLEQEATEKLSQADAAAAEAEGQLDELSHELEEARDAVKVVSYMLDDHCCSVGIAGTNSILLYLRMLASLQSFIRAEERRERWGEGGGRRAKAEGPEACAL